MGLSEDADQENTEERFRGLCADLNIDKNTADEAWRNYETISTNYTLEVNLQCRVKRLTCYWSVISYCHCLVGCVRQITPFTSLAVITMLLTGRFVPSFPMV